MIKKNKNVKTTFGPPPGGGLVSLITPSEMRSVQYQYDIMPGRGPRAEMIVGDVLGPTFPDGPQQPGVRFAGFGPIQGGTGFFAGVQGMLTVNSLIGISPHALSLMHVLHIIDPDGKYRSGRTA